MQANLDRCEKTRRSKTTAPDSPSLLETALAERERFLNENPHMRAFQDEIDTMLDKSGASHNRIAVLGTLMQGKLLEMQRELYKLTMILGEAIKG